MDETFAYIEHNVVKVLAFELNLKMKFVKQESTTDYSAYQGFGQPYLLNLLVVAGFQARTNFCYCPVTSKTKARCKSGQK